MFDMSVPWWQLIIRAAVVYLFLLAFVRLTGKRQIGQLAPFDLVLLLVLANAVQNSINGGDNSLVGGLIAVLTLIVLNHLLGYVTFKSKKLERIIEGRPRILVHNGTLYEDVMRKARLTHHELNSALRQGGCAHAGECRVAILENNGAISIVKKEKEDNEGRSDERHASKGHGIAGKKPGSSAQR